jgi:hypothetical protein
MVSALKARNHIEEMNQIVAAMKALNIPVDPRAAEGKYPLPPDPILSEQEKERIFLQKYPEAQRLKDEIKLLEAGNHISKRTTTFFLFFDNSISFFASKKKKSCFR